MMLHLKNLPLLLIISLMMAQSCYAPSQKKATQNPEPTYDSSVRPSIHKDRTRRPLFRGQKFDSKALNPGLTNQDYMQRVLLENKARATRARAPQMNN